MLFFTAAQIVFMGRVIKELEAGHAILTAHALDGIALPAQFDLERMILGNQRTDLPLKRADGTISIWGLLDGLWRAQILPKWAHGMRQAWHHPVRNLPKVQATLYQRLLQAVTTPDPLQASEKMGGALHTLQDTYTLSHTLREDNTDACSPMVRLYFSPSPKHPFISGHDRVWQAADVLTPSALAAVTASSVAIKLWIQLWPAQPDEAVAPLTEFVNQYLPIRGHAFSAAQ